MTEGMIQVDSLGKRYRLGESYRADRTLPDTVAGGCRSLWRRIRGRACDATERGDDAFWALRNVSFDVMRGESIGIVGRNGAGKSTLLKILSQITPPTEGAVRLRGRVASLLEVGTGFHPELTGRENIFLNGAVLGLTRKEIRQRFDEIVDFSGVERFLDTPVKRYSSGMTVRLAFAVAAHLEPDILIVDEVLAVGDTAFQAKCLGKMKQVSSTAGRTVLFVSHNMTAVRQLCERCLLLRDGQIVSAGPSEQVVREYLAAATPADTSGEVVWTDPAAAPGGEEARLMAVRLRDDLHQVSSHLEQDQPIHLELDYLARQPIRGCRIVLQVLTDEGVVVFSSVMDPANDDALEPGRYVSGATIPPSLLNCGRYVVAVAMLIPGMKTLVEGREHLRFTVVQGRRGNPHGRGNWPGVVAPALNWQTRSSDVPDQSPPMAA
ncbi:MAG: ABC transporter ATP-binding protein [Phycisphaeraceae bacterium]|nr:ABC transporter ATP-binding protein [Phycisphaeraceae bacterium]